MGNEDILDEPQDIIIRLGDDIDVKSDKQFRANSWALAFLPHGFLV